MNRARDISRVVSYYARPSSYSTGGVNTSRQQWMLSLAVAGTDVVVLNASGGYTTELVSHPRVTFAAIRHLGRSRVLMVPVGLASQVRRGDLVYLHEGWTLSNVVAALVCRAKRIPYVVMPHGVYAKPIVPTLKLHTLRRPFESWIASGARAVHLFFDGEVHELAAVSPRARSVVVATGFDLTAREWAPDESDPYVAWVGRFDILHKGIDSLLAAITSIPPDSRPHVRMHGPDYQGDKARVVSEVERLGLAPWVHVGGELPAERVLDFMQKSRGFVHVPRWEAFGRTIAEALAMGVPVVLGDAAQIAPSLAERGAARVVRTGSSSDIADGVTALWNGSVSTSAAGKQWVRENLDWSTRVAALTEHLRSLGIQLRARP